MLGLRFQRGESQRFYPHEENLVGVGQAPSEKGLGCGTCVRQAVDLREDSPTIQRSTGAWLSLGPIGRAGDGRPRDHQIVEEPPGGLRRGTLRCLKALPPASQGESGFLHPDCRRHSNAPFDLASSQLAGTALSGRPSPRGLTTYRLPLSVGSGQSAERAYVVRWQLFRLRGPDRARWRPSRPGSEPSIPRSATTIAAKLCRRP